MKKLNWKNIRYVKQETETEFEWAFLCIWSYPATCLWCLYKHFVFFCRISAESFHEVVKTWSSSVCSDDVQLICTSSSSRSRRIWNCRVSNDRACPSMSAHRCLPVVTSPLNTYFILHSICLDKLMANISHSRWQVCLAELSCNIFIITPHNHKIWAIFLRCRILLRSKAPPQKHEPKSVSESEINSTFWFSNLLSLTHKSCYTQILLKKFIIF